MCTFFTLTYQCGHSQISHRCPRSTTYKRGKDGQQTVHIEGCGISYSTGANLADDCMDCKLQKGTMPGAQSGAEDWARWGPKHDALAARVKGMQESILDMDFEMEGISETDLQKEGGTVQPMVQPTLPQEEYGSSIDMVADNWDEQVRAALLGLETGQTLDAMTNNERDGATGGVNAAVNATARQDQRYGRGSESEAWAEWGHDMVFH